MVPHSVEWHQDTHVWSCIIRMTLTTTLTLNFVFGGMAGKRISGSMHQINEHFPVTKAALTIIMPECSTQHLRHRLRSQEPHAGNKALQLAAVLAKDVHLNDEESELKAPQAGRYLASLVLYVSPPQLRLGSASTASASYRQFSTHPIPVTNSSHSSVCIALLRPVDWA